MVSSIKEPRAMRRKYEKAIYEMMGRPEWMLSG
jgi:hypothetical protein